MKELLMIVDITAAIGIIALVLVQQGKGADMGAVFGGGSGGGSQSLFGSKGSANFLSRTTAVLALVFFMTNIGLMVLNARQTAPESVTTKSITKDIEKPKIPGKTDKTKTDKTKVDKSKKTPSTGGVPAIPE